MKKLLLIFLLIAAWSVQAREVYPLCDDWLFSFRYENSSDNARCVTLPHTWNLDALAGTIPYLRTTADYQRKLYVPQTWTGKRLFLKFYGVESVAHLFVNGTYVGEHRGGTTAFVFEITDRVKYGSENLLRVAVSNAITGDVLPLSSIHNIYGGISREVELIVTDSTAVSPLYLGSSGVLIHPRAVSTERAEARGRNPPHLERRQLLPRDPRSVRSGRNSGRSQNDKGQTRRQTRRHPLHGRKSPTVGPRSPQPLSNAGIRRERHLAR